MLHGTAKLTYGNQKFDATWCRDPHTGERLVTGLSLGGRWFDPRSFLLPWAQALLNTALNRQIPDDERS